MARVEFAPEVVDDIDRIFAYLSHHAPGEASAGVGAILHALDALVHNPLIGRPVAKGNRELVIGRKAQGCVALYRYVDDIDTVFVLAVRSQREAGYRR
ncbi:plasmid stabilization protein [Massilia eurypsychrophila]|jgi:toxin ParE1/3/4|uniref:Plasmid stabilization protein n=1 Tax=Massilia eurypsychrophila TaxID=1485217 RepID=A0A2G8TC99_9BURK|nr:type II toxin-antitoxin system RelE/ParE family toxin [Massilia eurypsychrophila]PIL43614.1 plasmid stabilization protein [Massilia eurypsychrophila]